MRLLLCGLDAGAAASAGVQRASMLRPGAPRSTTCSLVSQPPQAVATKDTKVTQTPANMRLDRSGPPIDKGRLTATPANSPPSPHRQCIHGIYIMGTEQEASQGMLEADRYHYNLGACKGAAWVCFWWGAA